MSKDEVRERDFGLGRNDLEQFVSNPVWKALVALSLDKFGAAEDENRVIDPVKDPTTIARNQGMMAGLTWFTDQPAVLLEAVQYQNTLREREEKKNGPESE